MPYITPPYAVVRANQSSCLTRNPGSDAADGDALLGGTSVASGSLVGGGTSVASGLATRGASRTAAECGDG
jgi:hypothetical protein